MVISGGNIVLQKLYSPENRGHLAWLPEKIHHSFSLIVKIKFLVAGIRV